MLLSLAIIFVPLGAGMLYGSNQVEELTIDYSQCERMASRDFFTQVPDDYVTHSFHSNMSVRPQWRYATNESVEWEDERGLCQVQFQIPNDIGPPVFLFYMLKNFYANHRRYVQSFSEYQLNGEASSLAVIQDTAGQNCKPLSQDSEGRKIYPCGLIANSLFNDTFTFPVGVNGTSDDYEMTNDGIAWSSGRERFQKTKYNASEVVPPPNWYKMFPNGYTEDNIPDISTWPEFQNWMAPAGLPFFSKLALRNDNDVMRSGIYEVTVGLHFPVLPYNGHKYIYISTRSVIGGKNPFLGVSWIVAGGICMALSLAFVVINVVRPRKTGDVSLLSWNKEAANALEEE